VLCATAEQPLDAKTGARSVFDLRTSPFYLLGVSPRDNRAIIAQATETAISEGTLDETAATRAQQVLMAPRLRLGAELSWLPGLAPNRVKNLIEEATLSADAITGLPLLAGANLAAYRCSSKASPVYHELFFRFYERQNDNDILSLVNSERRAGNFPEATLDLLKEVMPDVTQQHTASFIEFITREPCPGNALLSILKEHFIDGSNVIGFLDEIAQRFDDWAAASFQQAEEAITRALTSIKEKPASLNEHLPAFSTAIGVWASVAAPHQFILARRHVSDPRTEQLLSNIRGVCLHLNNEIGDPKTPLALTQAALLAFEGSPGHLDLVRTDLKILEERVSDHDVFKVIQPLAEFVTELSSRHSELCASLRRGNFKRNGNGTAGKLFDLFQSSARDLSGTPGGAAPFRAILSLAIDLANNSQASEEALILVRALQTFSDVPKDDDLTESLRANGLIARQTVLQKQLATAAQAKHFGQSAKLAKELEEAANDDEDRAGWRKVRQTFEARSSKQRWSWGIGGAVVVGVIVMASVGDNRSTVSTTYRAPTAASTTYDQTSVSMPAPGAGVLSGPELRWCLLEIDRLKRIRQIVGESPTSAVANAWNARHTDWDGRCAEKKYYKSDHDVADRLVQTSAEKLQSEALAIYSSWSQPTSQRSAPAVPAPSTPHLVPGRPR
jgi:hypothetical protein